MSKLEELIEKLCPNGVEFKNLQYLCGTITTGKLNANAMEDNGLYPFFTCDSNPFKINTYAFDEEAILISGNGSQVGHINYYKGKFNAYQRTYVIYDFKEINVKFLLHYLNGYLKEYILRNCKKGSVPYITLPMLQKFSVPVPPLEVQCEIVHILDDFTLLSAELSAELKARQKQYEYYSEKLLNENCEENYVRLGDITKTITKGTTPKRFADKGINFIKTEAFDGMNINKNKLSFVDKETHNGFLKRSILEENDILFTIAGATIGKMAIVKKELLPANTNQALAIIRLKDDINVHYIKFILKSSFMKKYIKKCIKGSAQPNLNLQQLNDFLVPFPNDEKQKEIMNILERFDKLCNDISEGLPAEIEARQKQYEYYRDKLLTFKELKVNE